MSTYCCIGTWAGNGMADGMTVCLFDEVTGKLTPVWHGEKQICAGKAIVDSERGLLYMTNEVQNTPGRRFGGGGEIYGFRLDSETGVPEMVTKQLSYAVKPSYLMEDPSGRYLLVTNHGSRGYVTKTRKLEDGHYQIETCQDDSSVVLFPLTEDGEIGEPLDIYQAHGEGPLQFQLQAHLHSVNFDPAGRFFLVCDKGGDQIFTFRLEDEKIVPVADTPLKMEGGKAPRYSVFHPTNGLVYTNNEGKPVVDTLSYTPDGRLTHLYETWSTGSHKGEQSDLRLGADAKKLYSIVRGEDKIAVFHLDEQTGEPILVQSFPMGVAGARGFAFSPDGKYLVAAGTDSDEVAVYTVLPGGYLGETVFKMKVSKAATVTFLKGK